MSAAILSTPPQYTDISVIAVAFSPPVHDPEQDDIFLQSPFKSLPPVHCLYSQRVHKQPVPIDDDKGSIFLSPSSSPFFPPPTSQPLRTPVKEELRSMTCSMLKSKQLNAQSQVTSTSPVPGTGVGMKHKSSTASTPLSISATKANPASGVAFHRLAPLPAPRFGIQTMKHLRIRDMENSDEGWGVIEDEDSACEVEERSSLPTKKPLLNKLPLLSRRSKNQLCSPRKPLIIKAVPQKGSALNEVTKAISPGGHILKRWAPLEAHVPQAPQECKSDTITFCFISYTSSPKYRPLSKSPPVAFPSVTRNQTSVIRSVPPPSVSDSPMAHRCLTGGSGPPPFLQMNAPHGSSRAPMGRLVSTSSASLFFGPSIPQSTTKTRSRTASNAATSFARSRVNAHTLVSNRHSYTESGVEAIATLPWHSSLNIPSLESSPVSVPHGSHDDEDDMFFEPCGPPETLFVFSVTEGTSSPRSKGQKGKDMLPLKYKPRNSGVALSDDEGDASNSLSAMPQASTSSSLNSDIGDDLITPGTVPGFDSGWPTPFVISGSDNDNRINGVDVDAFILRTLAPGSQPPTEESKKLPGTPVMNLGAASGSKMKNGPCKS
ncbi:hypothetical protein OG21DRAFT_1490074 [Imleria badia]|nr:hypothetical protein OG21DRAFT_1490074 [Imleria badia]